MKTKNLMKKLSVVIILATALPLGSPLWADGKAQSPQPKAEVQVKENFRQDIEAALNQLKNAQTLESAYVGFTGALSENLRYLREVAGQEKAESLLQQIYDTGSLTGKLYAIIGFQLLDKNDLAKTLIKDAYQYQSEEIDAMEGCIIYRTTVGEALARIDEGYYVNEFRAAH